MATDRSPRATRGRRHRLALGAIVAVGLVAFVAVNGATLTIVRDGLSQIAPRPAAAGVVFSFAAMANRGLLNRAAHEAMGMRIPPLRMTRTAAVGFAANKVVKSAGVSGLAVLIRNGQRHGFAAARVVAACVAMAIASFAGLGVLLAVTLVLLARAGELTGWWIAIAVGFALYSLVVLIGLGAAWRSRAAAHRLSGAVLRLRNRLRRFATAPVPPRETGPDTDATDAAHTVDAVDELYATFAASAARRPALRRLLAHAVLSKGLGTLMLLAAATAVGIPITVRTALVVYAAALGASLITFVPGGVGVVEASTSALLVAAGAAPGRAVLAVALYRIFDVWMPVALGLALGRSELRGVDADADTTSPVPAVAYVSA